MITFDADVFGPDDDLPTEYFLLTGPADPTELAKAVSWAGARFMCVDETGREHPDDETAYEETEEEGLYTPNYVADPRITPRGVEGYVDCKGGIDPRMGEAFRRILREELERREITEATVSMRR